MKKYCVKCGHEFEAVGREVICPACKAQAAEDAKRAAVMRAKRASWTGESVPVRISGRASTIIRKYGASHTMSFSEALDALLKASDYFKGIGVAWQDVDPYKSRRRSKSTTEDEQEVKTAQAAKTSKASASKASASKASASKASASKASASKASASKAAGKKEGKRA